MEINSLDKGFLNSITDAAMAQEKAEDVRFSEILTRATEAEGQDDEGLMEACEAFEAYYLNKVFSQMRKTIPKTDLVEQGQGRDYYEDMLYDAYSKEIASGKGSGLKEMLYKQLKKDS